MLRQINQAENEERNREYKKVFKDQMKKYTFLAACANAVSACVRE